ncbi:MAG TPA: shikimate dehydrogenase [Gammaproteobacteria bacterium]|nr:shikimate dehydrogenase [Gammaproteobacteria bacterium]
MGDPFDFAAKADTYAVMGNPIAHSKSPQIHAAFARQTGQCIEYSAIQVDPGGFEQAVGNFFANGGMGLNITVPFKQTAWKLVHEHGPEAEHAGAVNTLLHDSNGHFIGRNTDGIGLVRDILQNHHGKIEGQRVLLVGAGGAARGVLQPLLAERPQRLVIANRSPARGVKLARDFAGISGTGQLYGGGFPDLGGETFDLIINASAASLHGEVPPLPDGILADGGWCYDMMYGAEPTPFVRWGLEHGAGLSLDGLGMLVEQAAESFYLWRGVRPDTTPVISEIRAGIEP